MGKRAQTLRRLQPTNVHIASSSNASHCRGGGLFGRRRKKGGLGCCAFLPIWPRPCARRRPRARCRAKNCVRPAAFPLGRNALPAPGRRVQSALKAATPAQLRRAYHDIYGKYYRLNHRQKSCNLCCCAGERPKLHRISGICKDNQFPIPTRGMLLSDGTFLLGTFDLVLSARPWCR